jgi:hypothetical protein
VPAGSATATGAATTFSRYGVPCFERGSWYNREQAQEHLATAVTMYRGMGMRFWLEQAEAELAGFR